MTGRSAFSESAERTRLHLHLSAGTDTLPGPGDRCDSALSVFLVDARSKKEDSVELKLARDVQCFYGGHIRTFDGAEGATARVVIRERRTK